MRHFSRALLLLALVAGIALPGEAAYFGAYIALGAGALSLVVFGWSERNCFLHPVSMAILAAIVLVCTTLPFVYRGQADLMAPVFILPMLVTIGLGLLARPIEWLPSAMILAWLCLLASFTAFLGGGYAYLVLDVGRVGLGNNPIHYASLASMTGGMALMGVVATASRWRYIFLLGPVFGLGTTVLSGSRGPLAGALVMAVIGVVFLLVWCWRDRLFRLAVFAALLLGVGVFAYLIATGNDRVTRISAALDIFRFTGGSDDIRAALYASAIHVFTESPVVGIGFGQIMLTAQQIYSEQTEVFALDNLHADWANFTVMAGGIGLIAWLLLLFAPLLLLLDPLVRKDRPLVLGAVLLLTGQAVLGISNAMFGVLPQTMVYAVALGYFLARARQLALSASQSERLKTGRVQLHRET
ncbi:O-antigen ligase family protein [Devosia sp. A369]